MKQGGLLLLILAIAWSLIGCATGDSLERALTRSQVLVHNSHQHASIQSEAGDVLSLKGRYNPCRCDAPQVELFLYGVWQRYLLAGEESLLEELRRQGELADRLGQLVDLRLKGHFSGQKVADSGLEYPVFAVVEFEIEGAE